MPKFPNETKVIAYANMYPFGVEILEIENDYVKFRYGTCFSDAENYVSSAKVQTSEILFRFNEDAVDFSDEEWESYFVTEEGVEVELKNCLRTERY